MYILCYIFFQNPILKSSERVYQLKTDGFVHDIISVNASGSIYVQPFQSMGEAHYHFVQYVLQIYTYLCYLIIILNKQMYKNCSILHRQTIELFSVKDITNKITTNNLQTTVLQHELSEADLTQGRGTPDKSFIFKSVSLLFLSSFLACFVIPVKFSSICCR